MVSNFQSTRLQFQPNHSSPVDRASISWPGPFHHIQSDPNPQSPLPWHVIRQKPTKSFTGLYKKSVYHEEDADFCTCHPLTCPSTYKASNSNMCNTLPRHNTPSLPGINQSVRCVPPERPGRYNLPLKPHPARKGFLGRRLSDSWNIA